MFSETKIKLRKSIINNEKISDVWSDNANKLISYANTTNNIEEEIACLEIIFDDIDSAFPKYMFFCSNWRMWLLGAYYDGGFINSPEAINLSLKFLEKGVETVVDDQYVPKIYSYIYCSLKSSGNPDYIKIAENIINRIPLSDQLINDKNKVKKTNKKSGGCYVATCVYGSYDCPEVWTLRRFRDNILEKHHLGRLFIKFYYAVSPKAVSLFGKYNWFHKIFKTPLDKLVEKLNKNGVENTPYND
ncbi:MAG TPA: hypothetical protein IAA41_07325 [Candidatus Eubacterium faecavium]|nr:hypothetical protein [Candidatus Eubacterium faecavium]